MQDVKLKAEKREVLGRKVKNLRQKQLIPANVYGKNTKSIAVSLKKDEFRKVLAEVGETGIVKLTVESEKEERPILIQNIQRDPLTNEPLHVDLRQIILTEKITAMIPVELSGEAPAVEQKLGILIQTASEIEVEALPMDLPEHFIVDVSQLANVGDEVTVKNLVYDKSKVKILTEDEELTLAKIEPLAEEEKVVVPAAEEVPAEGEVAPTEGAEKPAEGEEKPEEKKEEKKEKKE